MHGLLIFLFVENFPSLRVNCWRHLSVCPEQLGWAKAVLLPVLSCRSAHRIWRWVGCLVQHHPPRSHQVHPCQEKEPLGTCSYWTCKQHWGTEGEKGKILFFCSVEFFGVVFCFNHLQRSGIVIYPHPLILVMSLIYQLARFCWKSVDILGLSQQEPFCHCRTLKMTCFRVKTH